MNNKNVEKYKCWDCEKEIENVRLSEEIKKKCPKSLDGFLLIICKDCQDNKDY